jgi:hypothetical protein
MLTNEQTTCLQRAIEADDAQEIAEIIKEYDSETLSSLQLFGTHTLLMYCCEHASLDTVMLLLDKNLEVFELDWSDNNELKSTLRNEKHRNNILPHILKIIPDDVVEDMISTDWDPDPEGKDEVTSPLEMAALLDDSTCHSLLLAELKAR